MFGLSIGEIALILIVALLVLGPSKLPSVAKQLGKGMREFRRAASDLQRAFNEAAEADERARPPAPKVPGTLPTPPPMEAAHVAPAPPSAAAANATAAPAAASEAPATAPGDETPGAASRATKEPS